MVRDKIIESFAIRHESPIAYEVYGLVGVAAFSWALYDELTRPCGIRVDSFVLWSTGVLLASLFSLFNLRAVSAWQNRIESINEDGVTISRKSRATRTIQWQDALNVNASPLLSYIELVTRKGRNNIKIHDRSEGFNELFPDLVNALCENQASPPQKGSFPHWLHLRAYTIAFIALLVGTGVAFGAGYLHAIVALAGGYFLYDLSGEPYQIKLDDRGVLFRYLLKSRFMPYAKIQAVNFAEHEEEEEDWPTMGIVDAVDGFTAVIPSASAVIALRRMLATR